MRYAPTPTLSGKRAGTLGEVLLAHSGDRAQAPRLADVGVLGEAVGRVADHVAAQPQAREAALGLHPVQERQAQLAGAGRAAVENDLVGIVDLRPVDQRDVRRVGAGREQPARGDAAEAPQVLVELGVVEVRPDRERVLRGVRIQPARHEPVRARVGRGPAEARRELGVARPGRGIVWSSPARWSTAKQTVTGWRLPRLILGRRVRLAGRRLEADAVLGPGKRQQVAASRSRPGTSRPPPPCPPRPRAR